MAATPSLHGDLFGEEYFRTHCGPIPCERSAIWLETRAEMASQVIRSLRPGTVLDAGCAWGFLVEAFWDRGVEAWGVDISPYAIERVRPDMRPYCRVGSLAEPISDHYDLIVCIETLEHMPPAEADQAIKNLCAATDRILFSSTPGDFEESTHINVRPLIAWLGAFREAGFSPLLTFDASFVSPHAFLVERRPDPPSDEALALFCQKLMCQLSLDRARHDLIQSKGLVGQLEADRDTWLRAEAVVRGERDTWQSKAEEAELAIQDWISHGAEMRRKFARLEEASRPEREQLKQLQQLAARNAEIEQLARHLTAEYDSPAWQAILKYRAWISRARRNAVIRKVFEPALLSLLHRFGLQASPPRPRTHPQAAVQLSGGHSRDSPATPSEDSYQGWIRENEPDEAALLLQSRVSIHFGYRPTISIITPVYKVSLDVVRAMVDSVRRQTYDKWELCIIHADPTASDVRNYLERLTQEDSRVKLRLLDENLGIAGNSNLALSLASGDFLALLDHDDTLAPFALFEVIKELNENPQTDFLYSDKDEISAETAAPSRFNPLFKPSWSPEIMLSANYLTHLCILRTEVVREIGGWRTETDGAQDWDLFLRFLSKSRRIGHIPKILYHWRRIHTSVSTRGLDAKPFAKQGQVAALRDLCSSRGWDVDIQAPDAGTDIRVRWKSRATETVSIILLSSGDVADAVSAAKRLLDGADDLPVEIILLLAEPAELDELRIKAVPISARATFSSRIAEAVRHATGDILVFVDEHISPASEEWLRELTGPLQNAEIGLAGAKLLDANSRRIKHAGIVFDRDGWPHNIYAGASEDHYGIFGGPGWFRDWSAVSGACFAIRREVWLQTQEEPARHPRADIDLCLKVQMDLGLRVVYTPHARMFQSQASAWETPQAGGAEEQGAHYIRASLLDGDPYFNPNLCIRDGAVTFAPRPQQVPRLDYHAESQLLVTAFDFSPEELARSRKQSGVARSGRIARITWFLPEIGTLFYGGVHTILRFAAHFAEVHQVHSTFAIQGDINTSALHNRIAAVFPQLQTAANVIAVPSLVEAQDLPACDAAVATLWSTAYFALKFPRTPRKFYFLQDYEPMFYPAGSTSALVEATYDFGFTGICNTVSLRDIYAARGGRAEYFDPCVDPGVFHRGVRASGSGKPYLLFCYARPGHPRNSFELMMQTLRIVKERLGDRVGIVAAGAEWDPASYGLEGVVRNLGLLGYRATAALYRACDAGVVMMMTRHPSYLPLEMMACGCAVVTNRNPSTAWLLKDGENCVLPELSASCMADAVEAVLRDSQFRERLAANAAALVDRKYSDWTAQAEKIFDFMTKSDE